jgi:nitroimidazol reductase NimA-like FMN-containing flavoprotein (pyridoxamine 5'-phosphate oxidase superfamily)
MPADNADGQASELETGLKVTPRTSLKRLPERGTYDRAVIDAILDEALICHLGFTGPDGQPFVVPTICGRDGDTVYVHGSVASRMLRTLGKSAAACLTVTLLDGIVVARSGFHSSMNYRSVMLLGTPQRVDDPAEKARALDVIVDHVLPGRVPELRPPTDLEMRQTVVLALPIEEGSAKVRTGGPVDDEADLDGDSWAGVLPLDVVSGFPVPADDLRPDIAVPNSVATYQRPGAITPDGV